MDLWNVYCIATVVLRKQLNFKSAVKIFLLFVFSYFLTVRPWAECGSRFTRILFLFLIFLNFRCDQMQTSSRPTFNHAICNVYLPNVVET